MRDALTHLLYAGAATALMSLCFPVTADVQRFTGYVVGVSDGDTITVRAADGIVRKVRLAAIDAPEKGQPFGRRAKESLSDLVYRQDVNLQCHKTDRYRRAVCNVYNSSGDINLEQLRRGMAWWYRQYAAEQPPDKQAAYQSAEQAAKTARVGIWVEPHPVAPWEFRRTRAASKNK